MAPDSCDHSEHKEHAKAGRDDSKTAEPPIRDCFLLDDHPASGMLLDSQLGDLVR
jgi:hypothetical protein